MQIQLARVKTTPYLVIVGAGEINSYLWENHVLQVVGDEQKTNQRDDEQRTPGGKIS